MARVLITGASGFIGQHLSLAMNKSGWIVRGLSRSPRPPGLAEIDWRIGDILDEQFVDRVVRGSDAIIHLACLPLGQSTQNPVQALQINTQGTVRLLEAARRYETERFIFTSTGQVYGGQSQLPNKETDLPHPDSAYAVSKLSAEMWCGAYRHMYQLPVQILRLFNVYGLAADGTPRSTVETLFLQQLRQEQRPTVRGNPQSGRDFIHIRDVVRAIQLALTSPIWSGPLNIGTGILTTIEELARLAVHIVGKAIEPELLDSDNTTMHFQADTAFAQTVLGFQAEIKLESGLRDLMSRL